MDRCRLLMSAWAAIVFLPMLRCLGYVRAWFDTRREARHLAIRTEWWLARQDNTGRND